MFWGFFLTHPLSSTVSKQKLGNFWTYPVQCLGNTMSMVSPSLKIYLNSNSKLLSPDLCIFGIYTGPTSLVIALRLRTARTVYQLHLLGLISMKARRRPAQTRQASWPHWCWEPSEKYRKGRCLQLHHKGQKEAEEGQPRPEKPRYRTAVENRQNSVP